MVTVASLVPLVKDLAGTPVSTLLLMTLTVVAVAFNVPAARSALPANVAVPPVKPIAKVFAKICRRIAPTVEPVAMSASQESFVLPASVFFPVLRARKPVAVFALTPTLTGKTAVVVETSVLAEKPVLLASVVARLRSPTVPANA
jgi:hypothetical protein